MDATQLQFGIVSLKWAGAGLAGGGFGWSLYLTVTSPRSLAHRLGLSYVERLRRSLRSLHLWKEPESLALGQVALALGLFSGFAFLGSRASLVGAGLALVLPPAILTFLCAARRRRIDDQVNGFALALANALKTTASIGSALETATFVTTKPLAQELDIALKEVRFGCALDDALLSLSNRVGIKSLDVVVSSLLIGRQMGGDMPKILEETATSLRETKRLEKMTLAVTRRAKFSLGIAATTTLLVALGLPVVLPNAYAPLIASLSGKVVLGQCAAAYCIALFIGYRVTRVDV